MADNHDIFRLSRVMVDGGDHSLPCRTTALLKVVKKIKLLYNTMNNRTLKLIVMSAYISMF